MKLLRAACLPLILLSLLAGSAHAAQDLQHIVLQLRWHHQFQFAGYYMADVLGYYRDEGLQVEIRAGGVGIDPVAEVIDGQAHFGIDNSGLLNERRAGKPVVALAAVMQQSPMRLIVREDSGIVDIQDLRQRRVMLLPRYGSLALVAMLDQVGLLDQIDRQVSSHKITDLVDGNTDAFNGYASNEPFALQQQGIAYRSFNPADYDIRFYSDVLFTHENLARNEPELAAAFRRASLRGWDYALRNPQRAIDLIHRLLAPHKSPEHLRFEAEVISRASLADVIDVGHMSKLRWQRIQEQLLHLGVLSGPVDLDKFLFPEHNEDTRWQDIYPYLFAAGLLLSGLLAVSAFLAHRSHKLASQVELSRAAELRHYQLATHDHLTGLPNRLLLLDHLGKALSRSERQHNALGVAFFDLDNFKQVNDRYGHRRGDALLHAIAEQIESTRRGEDMLARLSGDEFVLVAEQLSAANACELGRRLLDQVHSAARSLHLEVDVGASIGILLIHNQALPAEQALELADQLMYRVKQAGRNRACYALYDDHGLGEAHYCSPHNRAGT